MSALRHSWLLFGLILQFLFVGNAGAQEKVTIYTEEFPPYNYIDDGDLAGTSIDTVNKIMLATGLLYEIRLLPWARTYREATRDRQSLIFSLARSQAREKQFDWLAPLARPEFYLYGRLDDDRLVSIYAILRGDYTAVCEESDGSCMILREAGFPSHRLFNSGEGGLSETKMVEYGRVDFYLGEFHHHPYRMKGLGVKTVKTKPVFKVGEGVALYLAAGLHVDLSIRRKVKEAYTRLLASGALVSPFSN